MRKSFYIIIGGLFITVKGNTQWTERSPATHPSARDNHAMAYDSESDRIVLFGGYLGAGQRSDETWEYDIITDTWTQKSPGTYPSARDRHAMAYDSESDRIVLFGGYGASVPLDDTWEYFPDTNDWVPLSLPSFPPARRWHTMAYSSYDVTTVLFGGEDSNFTLLSDTWIYSCVGVEEASTIKSSISLGWATSPFKKEVKIEYRVTGSNPRWVIIGIYNATGRLVKILVNGYHKPGSYTVRWNGEDESGNQLPSGLYFYRLIENGELTRKVILIR